MKIKTKLILNYPWILNSIRRSKKIAKKAAKDEGDTKYPYAWKNNWILKKSKKISKILNVDLEVEGYSNLPKGAFILAANHSSALDPAVVIMALEQTDKASEKENIQPVFIAKDDISKNKKVKGFSDVIDTFYISREKPREALKKLEEWIMFAKENRKAAVIFPEGTRSKDGDIKEFKSGAFKMAKKGFIPVVPCTIINALSGTDIKRKERLTIKVVFHPAIKPSSFITVDNKDLSAKVEKVVRSAWIKPTGKRSEKDNKIA